MAFHTTINATANMYPNILDLKIVGFKKARNKQMTILALLIQLLFSSVASASNPNSAGEFEMSLADGSTRSAVLLSTAVSGEIKGMLAKINIEQSFENNSGEWISGRYVFPLPENAAVDSLKLVIGDRVIEGLIQEKKQAQKTFAEAKKAGKKAGLLKQHRPNLFSIAVANIGPAETIVAHISYIDKVGYENSTFSLRFPTTLTPRYIPGAPLAKPNKEVQHANSTSETTIENIQTISINADGGWAANTDRVMDANSITPPQTHAKPNQTTHLFSFDLSLDAGLPLQRIESASHAINTYHFANTKATIGLMNQTELMDSDLVLEWQLAVGSAPQAALFQQNFIGSENSNHYAMLMVTPPPLGVTQPLPRDITFIIDSSGSMAGVSMQQAKQSLHEALQYLSSNDRFNIIDFDSQFRPLFSQSQMANQGNLGLAKSMINALHADGGTEMLGALDFALEQQTQHHNLVHNDQYLRQVIFITDGSIGNENELFQLIQTKLGSARLFTIGIGHAPNSYFMRKAAKFGRGSFTYVADVNTAAEKMAALFQKITQPQLRNIQVDWHGEVEFYPAQIPDLYAGEPILLLAKSPKPISEVDLSGELFEQQWQQKILMEESSSTSQAKAKNNSSRLNTLWARHKIESLMEDYVAKPAARQSLQATITKLALEHSLVSKFTSFVAVEKKISRPQGLKDKPKNVHNLMPKGSSMPAPNTASSADLYSLLGGLLILLCLVLIRHPAIVTMVTVANKPENRKGAHYAS